jgi:hypothetical protein
VYRARQQGRFGVTALQGLLVLAKRVSGKR